MIIEAMVATTYEDAEYGSFSKENLVQLAEDYKDKFVFSSFDDDNIVGKIISCDIKNNGNELYFTVNTHKLHAKYLVPAFKSEIDSDKLCYNNTKLVCLAFTNNPCDKTLKPIGE